MSRLKRFMKLYAPRVVYRGVTRDEKDMIVKAMGLVQGHWFKCPKGLSALLCASVRITLASTESTTIRKGIMGGLNLRWVVFNDLSVHEASEISKQ